MNTSISGGTILKSTSGNEDPVFGNTLIIVTEVNSNGAIGHVFNKRYPRNFKELVEFAHCNPFPLYEGGPMEHEKLFFIHNRPDLIEDSVALKNGIYSGGDFDKAVAYLNMGVLSETNMKMFIGYCGWDADQLEAEISEQAWTVLSDAPTVEHNPFYLYR